ncbi:hypothetical protein HQN84_08220 [Pedobacter steynii]|nr:hypothetical protein [Pedobacter steynii]NQX38832.1 hypothetical protein [Pedobacter steynii]
MSKKTTENFAKIVLNENVYIYKKLSNKFYSKRAITNLFQQSKGEKADLSCIILDKLELKEGVSLNGKPYKLSALILKYHTEASFISEPIKYWEEVKLAYLFLIDFGNYLIITKKNISGLRSIMQTVESIPYEVISGVLFTTKSLLEKLSMDNLDTSSTAMKARIVVSESLKDSFNYVGANTYMLNFLRLNNENDRFTISLNTSRIAKSGEKTSIIKLVDWTSHLISLIENFIEKETPLDLFAKPYEYSKERDNLTPISLTILFTRLLDEIENGTIEGAQYKYKDYLPRKININKLITKLSQFLKLNLGEDNYTYLVVNPENPIYKDLKVKLGEKSIRIYSNRLRNLDLLRNNDTSISFMDFTNNRSTFFINFDQCDYTYANRKLFKDSMLLGSIEQFLSIFIDEGSVNGITTEKGNLSKSSKFFNKNSAFNYVEERFKNSDFIVLDDLGGEWADHIIIKDSEISLVHSKTNNSKFSATAFTEIIGQAQKNMHVFNLPNTQINRKKTFWNSYYKKDKIVSKIPRLRTGSSVEDFIERFETIRVMPNHKKSVYLMVNFISKKLLETNLNKLKLDLDFAQRKEAIQILWQISSLIASCREHNASVYIICKP